MPMQTLKNTEDNLRMAPVTSAESFNMAMGSFRMPVNCILKVSFGFLNAEETCSMTWTVATNSTETFQNHGY